MRRDRVHMHCRVNESSFHRKFPRPCIDRARSRLDNCEIIKSRSSAGWYCEESGERRVVRHLNALRSDGIGSVNQLNCLYILISMIDKIHSIPRNSYRYRVSRLGGYAVALVIPNRRVMSGNEEGGI